MRFPGREQKKDPKYTGPVSPPVIAYFCLIILAFFISGCSEEKLKPSVAQGLRGELPSQESWNSRILFTEQGDLKGILYARHLMAYAERHETLLEDIKIDFYDRNGVKTTTLTAKRGRVDDITKNMYARDSVVAKSDSGVTLTTEELMWRNKDRKIVSDKFVTLVSPKEKIQGYGFEADQNLKNYVIYNITFVTAGKLPSGPASTAPSESFPQAPAVPEDPLKK